MMGHICWALVFDGPSFSLSAIKRREITSSNNSASTARTMDNRYCMVGVDIENEIVQSLGASIGREIVESVRRSVIFELPECRCRYVVTTDQYHQHIIAWTTSLECHILRSMDLHVAYIPVLM
jgi:hypothetical protein